MDEDDIYRHIPTEDKAINEVIEEKTKQALNSDNVFVRAKDKCIAFKIDLNNQVNGVIMRIKSNLDRIPVIGEHLNIILGLTLTLAVILVVVWKIDSIQTAYAKFGDYISHYFSTKVEPPSPEPIVVNDKEELARIEDEAKRNRQAQRDAKVSGTVAKEQTHVRHEPSRGPRANANHRQQNNDFLQIRSKDRNWVAYASIEEMLKSNLGLPMRTWNDKKVVFVRTMQEYEDLMKKGNVTIAYDRLEQKYIYESFKLPAELSADPSTKILVHAASSLARGDGLPSTATHQIAQHFMEECAAEKINPPKILRDAVHIVLNKKNRDENIAKFVDAYNKTNESKQNPTPCPAQIFGSCSYKGCPFNHSGSILNECLNAEFQRDPHSVLEEAPPKIITQILKKEEIKNESALGRQMAAIINPAINYSVVWLHPDGKEEFQGNAFKGANFFYTSSHVIPEGPDFARVYLVDNVSKRKFSIIDKYDILQDGVESEFQDVCKFTVDAQFMLEIRDRPSVKFAPTSSLNKEKRITMSFIDPETGIAQMRSGRMTHEGNGYFKHDIQTDFGYSGSPIFDEYRQHVVIGVHKAGSRTSPDNYGVSLNKCSH